ncbi:hypothetical protein BD821_11039 [Clostridium algidicarnis DSM 15099]|uniref:Uncharacterized protein n=1 Tax=Clostridium algidicarnis DSM 15099 TaxID=1121295 RepID=A0A2S6FWY4_9CLOT|nr:hypothetical protein BD821_11039 [Clostridium algidicarnis DSM 15099]
MWTIKNLNTSHVKVQSPILKLPLSKFIYLNTSHVKVQYEGQKTGISVDTYLNTSHVKVQSISHTSTTSSPSI